MVVLQPSKLAAWVRFPSPAPFFAHGAITEAERQRGWSMAHMCAVRNTGRELRRARGCHGGRAEARLEHGAHVRRAEHWARTTARTVRSAVVAQLVERHLAKVEVASPSLVYRSIMRPERGAFFVIFS